MTSRLMSLALQLSWLQTLRPSGLLLRNLVRATGHMTSVRFFSHRRSSLIILRLQAKHSHSLSGWMQSRSHGRLRRKTRANSGHKKQCSQNSESIKPSEGNSLNLLSSFPSVFEPFKICDPVTASSYQNAWEKKQRKPVRGLKLKLSNVGRSVLCKPRQSGEPGITAPHQTTDCNTSAPSGVAGEQNKIRDTPCSDVSGIPNMEHRIQCQRPNTIDHMLATTAANRIKSPQHEKDVFISCNNENNKVALDVLKLIESQGLTCLFPERDFRLGTSEIVAFESAVSCSRRIVLLLSRAFLEIGWCQYQLFLIVDEMYSSQWQRIVLVNVDLEEAEIPRCLKNLGIVDMRRDPNYKNKLLAMLTEPEVPLRELMPIGNVAQGLVWNYYLNYLQFVLPEMETRINKWCESANCLDTRMPRKLYILVPASCHCPDRLDKKDDCITFSGHIEEYKRNTAGCVDRIYKHSVWSLRQSDGTMLQFVGEYATVIHTMYLMETSSRNCFDAEQRRMQRDEFYDTLMIILKSNGHNSQAELIFIEDAEDSEIGGSLSAVLAPLIHRERLPQRPVTPGK